jgi:hypothetical protein
MIWRTHSDIINISGPPELGIPEYGVAIESEAIMPQLYDILANNHKQLAQRYKKIFTYSEKCLQANPQLFCQIPAYMGWLWTEYGGGYDKNSTLPPKTKGLSTVTSEKIMCPGHHLRQVVSQQLQGVADCYGNFFKNPVATSWDAIAPYRFHLAIENESSPNYFTEKLINCFQAKTVPIYWGCPNLEDFGFDTRGIVRVEDLITRIKSGEIIADIVSDKSYNVLQDAIECNYNLAISKYNESLEDVIYEQITNIK